MEDINGGMVEVSVDERGVLYVNVDGVCRLRAQNCKLITMDDPLRGYDIVWSKDEKNNVHT